VRQYLVGFAGYLSSLYKMTQGKISSVKLT
jgi:hypothetical protein